MIKEYKDPNELIKALQSYSWQDWFSRKRREEAASGLESIIHHSVGANTFRAFHNLPVRPSQVFRAWAHETLRSGSLRELVTVRSQGRFDGWLERFSRTFQTKWKARTGKEIAYGPGRKLPNLLVKRLCLFREIPLRVTSRLVWFLHVPLDNYSLGAIRVCARSFPNAARIGEMPRRATMSFVANERMCVALQEGIRKLAERATVPPIALDLLAWDAAHPGKD